jgi:hypothetical protein
MTTNSRANATDGSSLSTARQGSRTRKARRFEGDAEGRGYYTPACFRPGRLRNVCRNA